MIVIQALFYKHKQHFWLINVLLNTLAGENPEAIYDKKEYIINNVPEFHTFLSSVTKHLTFLILFTGPNFNNSINKILFTFNDILN